MAFINIKITSITLITTIDNPCAIWRPAAKRKDHIRLLRQGGKTGPIATEQVELGQLAATDISRDKHSVSNRRIAHTRHTLTPKGQLIRPGRLHQPNINRDIPDLCHTGNIGEKTERISVRRKAGAISRANIQIAFKTISFRCHKQLLLASRMRSAHSGICCYYNACMPQDEHSALTFFISYYTIHTYDIFSTFC